MDVDRINDVLIVKVYDDNLTNTFRDCGSTLEAVMAIVNDDVDGYKMTVQHGSLLHFLRRFGHLCYDTIVKMARDPASGIKLTNTKRVNCLACAQGKQTKIRQSHQDSGINSPIDVIGGVICSDLKGLMTSRDRLGNK